MYVLLDAGVLLTLVSEVPNNRWKAKIYVYLY